MIKTILLLKNTVYVVAGRELIKLLFTIRSICFAVMVTFAVSLTEK